MRFSKMTPAGGIALHTLLLVCGAVVEVQSSILDNFRSSFLDESSISSSSLSDLSVSSVFSDLRSVNARFYMYESDAITKASVLSSVADFGSVPSDRVIGHIVEDAAAERKTLEALRSHPLRTVDPSEADLFVIPTPIGDLLSHGCRRRDCSWFDDAFQALVESPTFQAHQGKDHVLVSYSWVAFNRRFSHMVPSLSMNYKALENVTVAGHCEYDGVDLHHLETDQRSSTGDRFDILFQEERPPLSPGFSIGLGLDDIFPPKYPSIDKFHNSDYFLFYRTRSDADQPFEFGSSPYRSAALKKEVLLALPPSSIGLTIHADKYQRDISSSKFCLVVRGDTPHTHVLLYAVRAGCIPVVVSDHYQQYAGPFKSTLAMDDFTLRIDEQAFLQDPAKELLALKHVPNLTIQTLLKNLAMVQQVVFPETLAASSEYSLSSYSPKSLFVQAFLKESLATFEKSETTDRSLALATTPGKGPVTVKMVSFDSQGKTLNYAYPSNAFEYISNKDSQKKKNTSSLFVGVFSMPSSRDARHYVRTTWAEDRDAVFFILAGPWEDVEDEYHLYGDIIWVDMEESYLHGLTHKRNVLIHAAGTQLKTDVYDYLFKADDDSFVNLDYIGKTLASGNGAELWGSCDYNGKPYRSKESTWYISEDVYPQDYYPPYAQGKGYAMSRSFVNCAVARMDNALNYLYFEDVATGILAHACEVSCVDDGFTDPTTGVDAVIHKLKGEWDLSIAHWKTKTLRGRTGVDVPGIGSDGPVPEVDHRGKAIGDLRRLMGRSVQLSVLPSMAPPPTPPPTPITTDGPTTTPTNTPTNSPTNSPTAVPTEIPTTSPTSTPTRNPTSSPTGAPTSNPTTSPTGAPTGSPTTSPTAAPTDSPTTSPTGAPTKSPTISPTAAPTRSPTTLRTTAPTALPTRNPTTSPTAAPISSSIELDASTCSAIDGQNKCVAATILANSVTNTISNSDTTVNAKIVCNLDVTNCQSENRLRRKLQSSGALFVFEIINPTGIDNLEVLAPLQTAITNGDFELTVKSEAENVNFEALTNVDVGDLIVVNSSPTSTPSMTPSSVASKVNKRPISKSNKRPISKAGKSTAAHRRTI